MHALRCSRYYSTRPALLPAPRKFFRAPIAILLAAFAALLVMPTQSVRAQTIVAIVNGEPITGYDVEQRTKLIQLSTRKTPARKEVIEELINDKVKVREAKKYSLVMSNDDLDRAFAGMGQRMNLNPDQFTKVLANAGVRADTMKARIRADVVWSQLVRGRFQQSLNVTDAEVRAAVNPGEAKDIESFEYRLLPVVLVVHRGSAPSVLEQRKREAETLRGQIKSCEEANRTFRAMRFAAVRESITKTSADLAPALRDILDKTPVGQLTAPEITKQGIEMFALCERKATKADSPAQRAAREKLFAQRFDERAKKYLEEARRSMLIEYR